MKPVTIEDNLKSATQQLREANSDSPCIDASVLLCHALDKPRSYLLTWPEKTLTQEEQDKFSRAMELRLAGQPIAYITGEREFWSLPLEVSKSTLIPRPDTERLVEVSLDLLSNYNGSVLDLGTGTGAIALAIASERPDLNVLGVDMQPEAASLATRNAQKLTIHNATFLCGSWFEPIVQSEHKTFALIVSNPPYIDEKDPHLQQGDVRFEPSSALVAGENGLADIRYIASQAKAYLQPEGWIAFEHGYDQGEAVRQLLLQFGYQDVKTEKDYAGNDRVSIGQKPLE
ncbi:peptide chain release factor N(5)-glutamine methyltransferase [Vibrio sp. S4M6]|uniref:peptide chain release factor N(5)-glutamine methyltransferase n=1 Tax=Vibrio sinus TaxID=2946865 RepID=UPI002029C8B0|nr:peptide chain release factor N(5)-glutamine methyltransferase [Vibrio sinus]MCL9781911.1 peptide chain release factor N(5)-glutamine methyltransferase [Vibrio sinus]